MTSDSPAGHSALGRQLVREQAEWSQFVEERCGPGALLIHVGLWDNDRRVYRIGDRVAKIVRRRGGRNQSERWFGQELEHEYQVMLKLDAGGYKHRPEFRTVGEWQILTMRAVQGDPFITLWETSRLVGRIRLLLTTMAAVERANRCGVWHGDLRGDNVSVELGRGAELVDWGSASLAGSTIARIREYARLIFGRHRVVHRLLMQTAMDWLPGAAYAYRRLKMSRPDAVLKMNVADEATATQFASQLAKLECAWKRGARWCQEHGRPLPLTALTVAGVHYPGQRALLLDWDCLRRVLTFRGKRVVDLACDVGLIPSLAMLAGAESALGVETEDRLADAASDVAEALGARAVFRAVETLEELSDDAGARDADVVIALAGADRLAPKPALLRFLGRHEEVIYETTESPEVECQRLHEVGFGEVEVVMTRDSGCRLLYGHRP